MGGSWASWHNWQGFPGRMLKSRLCHPPCPGAPRRAFSHAAFSHRSDPQHAEEGLSDVGISEGAFPFAKIHSRGERPTRSAVCTFSVLHSLRPCQRNGASWRAGVGRVRSLNFLSILLKASDG